MKILVVDDERMARRTLSGILERFSSSVVHEVASLHEARQQLAMHAYDVVLIDIRLSSDRENRDGLKLVQEVRAKTSAIPIVVSVFQEFPEIRAAMRLGAHDYILKDQLCDELVFTMLEELRSRRALESEVLTLRERCEALPGHLGLVGASAAMETLRTAIRRVALSDRPVLIAGPTGSGKELVARAIHALGANAEEPLIDINCGAIPDTLMESLLFGYERGAFTGAEQRRDGYFAMARQGSLFFDEIAEMPLGCQAKLLRVLESRRFRPVGATEERTFLGRVIAATHADLGERVRNGQFREDLYYRLNVLQLRVPALSERSEDIPLLVQQFAKQLSRPLQFHQAALAALCQRSYPGNIRELRNLVDRLAVYSPTELVTVEVLESTEVSSGRLPSETQPGSSLRELAQAALRLSRSALLPELEQALIEEALHMTKGNQSAAARLLGIHRKAIIRRRSL